MKILVCHRPGGAFGYITDGWINALRDKHHQVNRWDGTEESWRNFNPDIYIGCSGHKQNIPSNRTAKVAIHVNPYGPVDIDGINESSDNIKWVTAQRPDVVFGYGHEEDRLLWSYWKERKNIPWIPIPTAGDKTIFKKSSEADKKYDLVYLGGRWKYKAITIDEFLLPALNGLNYKLHGWGEWPDGISSGGLAEDAACQFLQSGRVGPCISEKHTHDYGIDIPERAFKVALCGTLIIHDATVAIRKMIPSAMIAMNAKQFSELCHYYSRPENSAERQELCNRQYNEVIGSNTYHHRMSLLFRSLGYIKESELMLAE